MVQVADPSWKLDPDIVANESAAERYYDDQYAIPDDDRDDEPEEEVEEETALITVTSLPQIQENLRALRERWEKKAADAATLICTEETVQTVKTIRAEMRKEFDEADAQRKAAKARYLAPWEEVERTYKECVSDAFKRADGALKGKIEAFETELKDRCKENLREYFDELCAVHGVDFLSLDTAMNIGKLKIGMADATAKTPRRIMDGLSEVVAKVAVGMDQVMAMDDAPEIMAEYKTSFDVGHAVACVQGRKKLIQQEQERAEARRSAQERREAAAEKVAALMPPAPAEDPQEPVFEAITFTIKNVTRSQAIKVREFLKQEGISYE